MQVALRPDVVSEQPAGGPPTDFAATPVAASITERWSERPEKPEPHEWRAEPTIAFEAVREHPGAGRWLARAAIAAAMVGAAAYGWSVFKAKPADKPAASVASTPAVAGPSHAGTLHVASEPSGAQVLVDGKPRGTTPLVIDGMGVGRHTVEIESGEGTIKRTVAIEAGQETDVDEAIYAGWVTVYAPFDVTVSEGGRELSTDDQNQIMVRPGAHELRISNSLLAFDDVRKVDVKPGQVTTVYVTPPKSTLTVTATDGADVFIDGTRAGAAPLFSFAIDIGTHEVVVRRPGGAERRVSVTVTTKPQTVNVDFAKPGA